MILGEDMNMTTPVMRASCEERCVESYFPGRPCYCNDACDQYENCCYDFYEVCKRKNNTIIVRNQCLLAQNIYHAVSANSVNDFCARILGNAHFHIKIIFYYIIK